MPTGIYIHKPRSEETKRKMSIAMMGHRHKVSEETKRKISLKLKGRKGIPRSEEYKIRMSQERKGICFNTGRTHFKKGEHHSPETEFKFKGGRFYNSEGYVLLYKPEHPFADKKGYILEHRLILEKQIGRYLHKWEISHHINGIKDDNRPENLKLFANVSEHIKFHKGDN